jgi:hypothetical protein
MRPIHIANVVFVVIVIGGIAFLISLNLPMWSLKVWMFVFIATVALTAVATYSALNRRRTASLKEELASHDFVLSGTDGSAPKVLHHRPHKGESKFVIFFSAIGLHGGVPAHVADYCVTIGRDRKATGFNALEVAIDLPGVPSAVTLTRRAGLLRRRTSKPLVRPPTESSNKRFSSRWDVECVDQALAQSILTPALSAWLAGSPRVERSWRIEGGWLSCTWRRLCYREDLREMLARVQEFAALVGTPAVRVNNPGA